MRKVPAYVAKKVPPLNRVLREKIELESENHQLKLDVERSTKKLRLLEKQLSEAKKWTFVPHDHFYSPIPNIDEIKKREAKIWGPGKKQVADIELHETEQLKLVNSLAQYYPEQPFSDKKTKGRRFYF